MEKKRTPAQKRLLTKLALRGPQTDYQLGYPRTPMVARLRQEGMLSVKTDDKGRPTYEITAAGRKAINL